MPDRPAASESSRGGSPRRPAPRWPSAFLAVAGLIGAAGVAVGAAGAHGRGGDLARLASQYMLIHAAAIVGGSGVTLMAGRGRALLAAALALLCAGTILFGGDLAFAALLDWRPLPLAAPAGGLCLIAGWLCLAGAGLAPAFGRGRDTGRA